MSAATLSRVPAKAETSCLCRGTAQPTEAPAFAGRWIGEMRDE